MVVRDATMIFARASLMSLNAIPTVSLEFTRQTFFIGYGPSVE